MFRLIDWAPACAGVTILFASTAALAGSFPGVGRTATPAEIKAWDIDVRPDFKGLPPGSGSAAEGQQVWESKCMSCHGVFGESNEVYTPLIGGTTQEDIRTGRVKTLVTGDVARTTFMKLSSISSLWDYVNRAMPWNAPKSLSTEEVYAVVAYMLNLADIVPADFVLSDRNIAEVQQKLPNRNGVTRDHGLWDVRGKPDVKNTACMKNCTTEVRVSSVIPDSERGSHGDLSSQNRAVGAVRGGDKVAETTAPPAASGMADLAKRKACLACHGIEKRVVGPSLKEIAARYQGEADIESRLVDKVKKGGSGAWGPMVMPPHPDLADEDARALVRWVLGGASTP
jgi:S-disulfanyl-L-cysteine oxidoreductase SoxD